MSEQTVAPTDNVDEGRTVRLSIPAKAEYITLSRRALSGLSRVRPLSEEVLADLKLALTEACSNSVRHAYDNDEGHVSISFELRDDRLIIEVSDDGSGFDSEHAGKNGHNGDNGEELTEGGLGIAIIKSIADDFELESKPGVRGSTLRFVKKLS